MAKNTDSMTVYIDDDTAFQLELTQDRKIQDPIDPTATVRASIVQWIDDVRTVLIGPLTVPEVGTPTDDWANRIIQIVVPNALTTGLSPTDCADVEVVIDTGGSQLTWPERCDQRPGRIKIAKRGTPR